MTIIPVMDRNTGGFLGMVSSNEILKLVALMGEIREEARRMSDDSEPDTAALWRMARNTGGLVLR